MATPPIVQSLVSDKVQLISTIEMHTTGEPTRIIYSGFPPLQGSRLLEKRADAKINHDHLRTRLMLEPRGHKAMYGALLVHETELTATGEADIGVLFMHNEGWSTMCGHATIALGRLLVDSSGESSSGLFPASKLQLDEKTLTTAIKLHCPCGVVNVTVPVSVGPQGRLQSDPERPVSFISVDSFATGIDIEIPLPMNYRWPELGERTKVTADFCYGGAFYCVIGARELGFSQGLTHSSLNALSLSTAKLKAALTADPQFRTLFQHPEEKDLGFVYGVIVTDERQGQAADGTVGGNTCVCFFADQQVDRSPTGSGVAARRALAHAKGLMEPEQRFTYHSLVSIDHGGQGAFIAQVVGEPVRGGLVGDGVRVRVEGCAFYTGFSTFLAEEGDGIGEAGFAF